MDDVDRVLIGRLQDGIPVTERPFLPVAEALGLDEREVCARIERLIESGVLGRFAAMVDIERAGGCYCLCAMAVPAAEVEEAAARINACEAVAHHYLREHRLNLWFVLAAESAAEVERAARAIERACARPVLRLPKLEEYYIGLRLEP